jgi:hypothetical protein
MTLVACRTDRLRRCSTAGKALKRRTGIVTKGRRGWGRREDHRFRRRRLWRDEQRLPGCCATGAIPGLPLGGLFLCEGYTLAHGGKNRMHRGDKGCAGVMRRCPRREGETQEEGKREQAQGGVSHRNLLSQSKGRGQWQCEGFQTSKYHVVGCTAEAQRTADH